jgi:hypothetical protein
MQAKMFIYYQKEAIGIGDNKLGESEHLKCKHDLHILNNSLFCHKVWSTYLKNAFGDWRPDETHIWHGTQEVFELIKQKWHSFCNGDDAYQYTLKHLVNLIENGAIVSKDVQKHVTNGCKETNHNLDNIHTCFYGYLRHLEERNQSGILSTASLQIKILQRKFIKEFVTESLLLQIHPGKKYINVYQNISISFNLGC